MDGSHFTNGPAPQPNGLQNQQQSTSQAQLLRIPTVKEALPYTPFSSIVPFNPDLITPALSLPSTTPTAFDYSDDIKHTRSELERLSNGAQKAEDASKRCRQTLRDVQRLLDPDTLTQFQFKTTKKTKASNPNISAKKPTLSSFAKMVLDTTEVGFRYLTPATTPVEDSDNIVVKSRQKTKPEAAEDSDNIVVKSSQKARPPQSTPIPQQRGQQPQPGIAYVQIPSSSLQTQTGIVSSQTATPAPSQATPTAFVRPAKLTPAQLAEYQKVATSSDPRDSTPSRNQSAFLTNKTRAVSQDQRLKADQAVETLQSLLQEIFAAEDQLEPDTSGKVSKLASAYFTVRDGDSGSIPVLQSEAQSRLEGAIQKVVSHGRLDDIEVEQLSRTQKLCEGAIVAVASMSLEIGEDWNEQDTMDWLARIENAKTGLFATRTMMRIMAGGSHHRELQSEDYLQAVLEATRAVVERCIIPVVDLRPQLGEKVKGEKNAPRDPRFDIATDTRKQMKSIIAATMKCLKLMGDLFIKIDMDESGISNLEYTCKILLFAQNGATEKDSALGVQAFEDLRVSAMDVLARIFTKYTTQRNFIIDEILLSLEKLPATKQSARQFPLIDAKPIQLVSALLMRLVQTSATTNTKVLKTDEDDEESSEESEIDDSEEDDSDDSEENIKLSSRKRKSRNAKPKASNRDLPSIYKPLKEDSQKHASYIVHVLLQRALTTTKSSTDEPFRKLLDIFVADFLNVLGSCDWPAAEVLLRVLVTRLVGIAEVPKSPAPSRTLALELLGVIGSGILDVQSGTINAARALDADNPTSRMLKEVAGLVESGDLVSPAMTAFNGPYRLVIEYLHDRGLDSSLLQTARGYHLVQWADLVCINREGSTEDGVSVTPSSRDLQSKIRHMIEDVQWLEENSQISSISTTQGRLAGKILASTSLLARAFNRIFNVVLQSMTSEQPTVRSRALKSVTTVLEQDPSVLDRNSQVLAQIVRCLGDPSPLVRESALSLVQKCVALRPALELKVYERVVARTTDASPSVRKRSMAFLKQVYIRNNQNKIRAPISNALISRIKDTDEGVAEVALSTIEDVWFSALYDTKTSADVDTTLRLRSHAALIIQTVDLGDNVANVLQDLIKTLLTKSKQKTENFKICQMFVSTIFDIFEDPKERTPGDDTQVAALRALEVFGKAAPKLFTAAQIGILEIYVGHVVSSSDLELFHSVLVIFRYTLPVVHDVNVAQLQKILSWLLGYAAKVPTSELRVAAPCIETIGLILGNKDRARTLAQSAMTKVHAKRNDNLQLDVKNVVGRLITIIGQLGKACNFEKDITVFKAAFPAFRGTSVASLMVELCCHFTSPRQPLLPRVAALEAVCEICQSFPENFLRTDVVNAIEAVLTSRNPALEGALLASLEGFFAKEEDDAEASEILGTGIESGAQRLGGTYQAKGFDSASASLSQRFLKEFLRIALSAIDDNALCAARIVSWINERGMAHPGESGPGLVALQTCPGSAIAKLAFKAYMEQYAKHENVFEKTLVKSVQQAFEYQLRVVRNATGYTGQPPVSKLHFFWQTLKSGKPKVRTKFFTNVCVAMDFDPVKLDLSGASPQHLLFVRFCVENFAFLEYERGDEIVHLLSCLEKTFSGTGTALVQSIESEVLNLQVPVASSSTMNGDTAAGAFPEAIPAPAAPTIDPTRLQQLAVSSQLLSLMWETRTYLRRLWNLQKYLGKQKSTAKESAKPSRATNAPALTENYQSRINNIMALATTDEARRGMCTAFVELFSVDNEVKVGSEEEDDIKYDDGDDARSEGSSGKSASVGPGPRGKKRKSVDGGSGPAKKRSRPRKSSSAKESDEESGWV